jgi:hypothetical protein
MGRAMPAIGEWRQASPYDPVREPVEGEAVPEGSVNTTVSLGAAVRFGHAGRGHDHYRGIGAFGKMLCDCAMNATESQHRAAGREVPLTKRRL